MSIINGKRNVCTIYTNINTFIKTKNSTYDNFMNFFLDKSGTKVPKIDLVFLITKYRVKLGLTPFCKNL